MASFLTAAEGKAFARRLFGPHGKIWGVGWARGPEPAAWVVGVWISRGTRGYRLNLPVGTGLTIEDALRVAEANVARVSPDGLCFFHIIKRPAGMPPFYFEECVACQKSESSEPKMTKRPRLPISEKLNLLLRQRRPQTTPSSP